MLNFFNISIGYVNQLYTFMLSIGAQQIIHLR